MADDNAWLPFEDLMTVSHNAGEGPEIRAHMQ